jgi:hypothetical protein
MEYQISNQQDDLGQQNKKNNDLQNDLLLAEQKLKISLKKLIEKDNLIQDYHYQ